MIAFFKACTKGLNDMHGKGNSTLVLLSLLFKHHGIIRSHGKQNKEIK